jgi:ABC-2 type transport system ATP-binding protein
MLGETPTVQIERVSKDFGATQAVRDVSLEMRPGEIFGLLGPNGAGKTTLIRMTLDIFRPDSGRIAVFGGAMTEAKKERIGYLPEERGLYADVKLMRIIHYLAALKGLSRETTNRRAEEYLRRLDLWDHRDKTLRQLSRGMHQKAQFIVTVLHDPDLIIVDEPFSGLDPVNTQLIEDMLLELRDAGKCIIMSTHQMHQVEAMCDRIALINRGRCVLEGPVNEVRRRYAGNSVQIAGSGPFDALPLVKHARQEDGGWRLTPVDGATPQELLRELSRREDVIIEQFAVAVPSLHDIFINVVGEDPDAPAASPLIGDSSPAAAA